MGNPGDVAFEQKTKKSNYFSDLLEYCTERNKNVYLFFDEIHASIHNFKNEYINNITIWKNVVHKCVVSTATYTEPVNIVVKYLAYLTDDNINVIQCDRIKRQKVTIYCKVFQFYFIGYPLIQLAINITLNSGLMGFFLASYCPLLL